MKYILYKTTNLINNYIYIGVHKTKNPNVFDCYLGCGVRTNKPSTYEKAKTAFQKAVKEFGINNFRREVLAVFNTDKEAYMAEGLIVNEEFLARPDVYNILLGGAINYAKGKKVYEYDGTTGSLLKEYKSCASVAEEIGCNSTTISRAILYNYKADGRCFSYEKYDVIDLGIFENPNESITVYRYLITGEYDTEFASLNDAGKNTLDTVASYIHKAAILGYSVKDKYYFSLYKENSYDKARNKQIQNREVHKYNENGEFVKSYNSQKEAELDNPYCNITKAIKLRSKDKNGNYWSLDKLKAFNIPIYRTSKKVALFDDYGNVVKTWDSSNQCAKEVGTSVKNVLRGLWERHKGKIYKYID